MKLVRRLTIYLLIAIGVVFALDTYLSLVQHLALFDAGVRGNERAMGRALGAAVERAWADRGERYALDLVREVNARKGHIQIRFVYLDGAPGTELGPDAPQDALEAIRREEAVSHVRDYRKREDPRIYTYIPLVIPSKRSAALELSESLANEHEYLVSRLGREFSTALAMVGACGIVTWLVGTRFVGRPIHDLMEKARRTGTGDFSGPLVLRRSDELSRLAEEMNLMAEHLAAESSARITALEQLHHAERLGTIGKLASGIAHELGTPLNVVSGRAQMIVSGEIAAPDEVAKAARIVVEQVERMTRIVRQLLDFSRRRRAEKRSTDVSQLARQTAALLGPLATSHEVELQCVGSPAPLDVAADPGQLQQALTNLVVNAIQATSRGGHVTIRAEAQQPAPDAPVGRQTGPYIVLAVEDDGEGIPADRLSSIFDPFFTTKPVGEGTGLGLSVAYGIAQEHGGWIDVRSAPGQGSCFRIWLPPKE